MPFAWGPVPARGVIRATPDDFQVDEVLGFDPDGEGEHLLLQLRKRQTNTHWMAGELARLAKIPASDVSYAGMKDRQAVTTQWFSLRMAGRTEPDWNQLQNDLVQILQVHRHRRKLRRGALSGNQFIIRIRELVGDQEALEQRLIQMRESGIPNYFGEQRFGRDYQNLKRAEQLFSRSGPRMKRHQRGLVISAVRAQLFNQVLAERIAQENWDTPLRGDYFSLNGSRSGFSDDPEQQAELSLRCRLQDIHPSGPLWGRGLPLVDDQAGELEASVLSAFGAWRDGLEHVGLKQERRPLRVGLRDLTWCFTEEGGLELRFFLPAGSFATVLLRELVDY
jgi:tRNA pseudouridine13 synthase